MGANMLSLYWHKLLIPYWPKALKAILCFIIASVAGLSAPIIIKLLIDGALVNGNVMYLHVIVGTIIVLYLVRGIFYYVYNYTMAKIGNDMVAKLREKMFIEMHAKDYAYFVRASSGELISLFTNDLWLLQQAVSLGIPDIVVESINLLCIMLIMIYFDWQLALVTFVTLPFIVLAISFFNKKIGYFSSMMEHTLAKVTSILHQFLVSVSVVQSYVREDYEYKRFSAKVEEAAADYLRAQKLNALLVPLVEFMAAIGLTIIVWYGGREVINGSLSIGGMFAFLVYIINVPAPVRKISEAYTRLKMGVVAWNRMRQIECCNKPTVHNGTRELKRAIGEIEFRDVSFGYSHGIGILSKINLRIKPGELVAVIGPSGAGKSSFANLMLRLYDPSEGGIYLDGINIKDLKITSLRSHIGFIQQEPILFNTTILENIKYGRLNASQEEVDAAAVMADAYQFIMELPNGYHTKVGELGGNLSGGQRQRIALARAIIMKPTILLLDEPTAALDAHAEKQVMNAIRKVSLGITTVIITHRLTTLIDSDKVIYLSGGNIAEVGTHLELIQSGGIYSRAVKFGQLT